MSPSKTPILQYTGLPETVVLWEEEVYSIIYLKKKKLSNLTFEGTITPVILNCCKRLQNSLFEQLREDYKVKHMKAKAALLFT